jgi:hypothetical protein
VAAIDSLAKEIGDDARSHNPRLDSFLHNTFAIAAGVCTAIATGFSWTDDNGWVPRLLTALATILIIVYSRLHFGERWRFHTTMRNGYRALAVELERVRDLPEPQQAAELDRVQEELKALREKEADRPGMMFWEGAPT